MAGVRSGVKRLVIGPSERGLDVWSRLLPGRLAISSTEGLVGRIIRSSIRVGCALTRGEWAALLAGGVLGLEIGLHVCGTARL